MNANHWILHLLHNDPYRVMSLVIKQYNAKGKKMFDICANDVRNQQQKQCREECMGISSILDSPSLDKLKIIQKYQGEI